MSRGDIHNIPHPLLPHSHTAFVMPHDAQCMEFRETQGRAKDKHVILLKHACTKTEIKIVELVICSIFTVLVRINYKGTYEQHNMYHEISGHTS